MLFIKTEVVVDARRATDDPADRKSLPSNYFEPLVHFKLIHQGTNPPQVTIDGADNPERVKSAAELLLNICMDLYPEKFLPEEIAEHEARRARIG